MTAEVKEQVVVRLGTLDKPVHCADNVGSCGVGHGIRLIVRENDHIVPGKVVARVHELGHVADIVDTSLQLIRRSKIIDANQQCLER